MSTVGQRIIGAIIKGGLCHASCANEPEHNCIVVWSVGSAEQIDAIAEAELTALRAEVAELRKDRARIDWLEDNGHHIHVSCWHASPAKENEWTIHDGDFDGEPIGADKLLRAAIDAARKEGA